MSYYLHFRKNGTPIVNYCRVTTIYEILSDYAPWDKWEVIELKTLQDAHKDCEKYIANTNIEIEKYELLLNGCYDFDTRSDAIDMLKDAERRLKDYERVLIMIEMIMDIWNEPDLSNGEDYTPTPLEWGIF